VPYSFNDIVRSLNDVAPGDWATLLTNRLEQTRPEVPKDGLNRGGYKLAYTDQPSEWVSRLEQRNKVLLLDFSLGATVTEAGVVSAVRWGSPAFLAGILPGDRITHVSSQAFTVELLRSALAATSTSAAHAIDLTIDGADGRRTVRVEGLSGNRYPHLVPVEGQPDVLDAIFSPTGPSMTPPR
jgi:predicted metalloprotease with PDZ domain